MEYSIYVDIDVGINMQFFSQVKLDVESILRKTGLITLVLFSLILFQSKALINILGGLALLLSIIYIFLYDRNILRAQRYLLFLVLPFLIGLALSIFSSSGVLGPLVFIARFKFMLFVIPFAVFIKSQKELHWLIGALMASGFIAVGYGVLMGQPYGSFSGFHIIGRTADMMIVVSLITFVYLLLSTFNLSIKSILFHSLMTIAFMLFSWALLMSEMRGSWLGMIIAYIALLLVLTRFHRKASLFSVIMIIFAFAFIYIGNIGEIRSKVDRIYQQAESIVDTKSNASNNARLHLWKTGWDFSKNQFLFGTGAKQSKQMFKDFFEAQPNEYQQKYHWATRYPGDYHNSYLQMHIEAGAIFTFSFMISIIFLLFVMFKNIKVVPPEKQKYLIAAVIAPVGFLVAQVFHGELYHYGSAAFYIVLFSGCYTLNRESPNAWLTISKKHEL